MEPLQTPALTPDQVTVMDRCRVAENGCWIWRRPPNKDGYGQIGFVENGRAKNLTAHRFSFLAFRGEIPAHLRVSHTCHEPMCVNPEHLFLATHRESMNHAAGIGAFLPRNRQP